MKDRRNNSRTVRKSCVKDIECREKILGIKVVPRKHSSFALIVKDFLFSGGNYVIERIRNFI